MDVFICCGLTVLELVALRPSRELDSLWIFKKFVAVFLIQYAVLKFYRIVLYPNFFSPLRHLPGPKVFCETNPPHSILLHSDLACRIII